MPHDKGKIDVYFTDREINNYLKGELPGELPYTRHFNQSGEFFLKLHDPITIPPLKIHHNVYNKSPDDTYISQITSLVKQIRKAVPELLQDLSYSFDPADVLRPGFFQVYRISGRIFLYYLKLDISYRPQEHRVLERINNDHIPTYKTRKLMIEADFIPLEKLHSEANKIRDFVLDQSISSTWVGQTGRGYFVQGIWLDDDLTKFFSKIFIPPGKLLYPYFPINCKYRAICYSPVRLGPDDRRRSLPFHLRAIDYLRPHIDSILESIRSNKFSEELDIFKKLKGGLPADLEDPFASIRLRSYLDEDERKEYIIED